MQPTKVRVRIREHLTVERNFDMFVDLDRNVETQVTPYLTRAEIIHNFHVIETEGQEIEVTQGPRILAAMILE